MTALLLPHVKNTHVLIENTVRTKGIQLTLYFIMSSISLVKHVVI